MTARQQRFVHEYLVDLNATRAAVRSGYSKRTARAIGHENLTKPDIQRAIRAGVAQLHGRLDVRAEAVVLEAARLALSDIGAVIGPNGTVVDVRLLPDDLRRAIKSVEVTTHADGSVTQKVTLWDKGRAQEFLGKHFGILKDPPAPVPPGSDVSFELDPEKLARMSREDLERVVDAGRRLMHVLVSPPPSGGRPRDGLASRNARDE